MMRLIGIGEMLLSVPLLVYAVWVIGGVPLNGLIVLANASASYLLGRYTYNKGPSIGYAVINFCHLLTVMLLSFVTTRVIADMVR